MEEFERRRGMLTTGNGATQSVTCCTMCKSSSVGRGLGSTGLRIVAVVLGHRRPA